MKNDPVREGLVRFSETVTSKSTATVQGAPEDQLRAPLEELFRHLGAAWGWAVACTGEVWEGRLGRPDYAVSRNGLLTGHVELKKPGTGAVAARFTGHDKEQFKRFKNLPNILYTDGNEWALYRDGRRVRGVVRLAGAVDADGLAAVGPRDGKRLEPVLRDFLEWRPILPLAGSGAVDLRAFAEMLAPLCRLLRGDVEAALSRPESPIHAAAQDWRYLLFPEASDERFADAYAQTVTFALLLGRSLGAEPLSLSAAEEALDARHNLLARALRFLTDSQVRREIGAALDLLTRVVGVVPPGTLGGADDPWLHFYEDFLAAYDAKLRKKAGVYYTPVEVVQAQVRLVDELLTSRLGRRLGFASSDVVALDPAVGTGTYLLGVIKHTLDRVGAEQGPGAVAGQASSLARRIHGFEIMVGPYAVAELRTSRALRERGGDLPEEGTGIYLADTLDSPDAEPAQLGLLLQPIADQRSRALEVKKNVPVLVCVGNPPYHRHGAVDATLQEGLAAAGGWVRFGDPLPETEQFRKMSSKKRLEHRQDDSLMAAFIEPAKAAGHGVDLKNLYNSYVYFWRWALWKVFEQEAAPGPGIVSFITASSYLLGNAFVGIREHMRRLCDEIWILDLGGDGRGPRREPSVFAIQTPVAIAVLFRSGTRTGEPAPVRYARIGGSRAEKLKTLDGLKRLSSVSWQDCPDHWQARFFPAGKGRYFEWPLLTDLMPWQHSGIEVQRTWPVAPDSDTLHRRWHGLLAAPDRAKAYREARDRKVAGVYSNEWLTGDEDSTPIALVQDDAPLPRLERYAYRSLDRQYLIADSRLVSYLRPELWRSHSPRQVFLLSLLGNPLGGGPALTACSTVPDRHFFRGSYGGKDVLPLYRSPDGAETNLLPGLLDRLGGLFEESVSPEDFVAYLYGVLAHPSFVQHFFDQLGTCEVRVPLTKDARLFRQAGALGRELLRLHTYGERFAPANGEDPGIPNGEARCCVAVPGDPDGYPESYTYDEATRTLRVGDGAFAPVSLSVYEFEVSGLKVVQSWLGYRMKKGAGKKTSPLDYIRPERWTDEFTTDLLDLLHVLEATLKIYPEQGRLLDEVLAGDCIQAHDLPQVPDEMRKAPKPRKETGQILISH
ncbi:MAG: N-6 DNA methylase [Holophagales bacterium]|nr:N-6 DNA methylase [Holophagales bacterium]MYH24643.1 N-6 DNA methylase [Holophagales bacterium]